MSYYLLVRGDGSTPEQYAISREFVYLWGIYPAVTKEFTYLWDILEGIQNYFTYKWNIYSYVSRQFTYIWGIGYYIQREFTYLWNLYETGVGVVGKVKYSFLKSRVVTRFFRITRIG
jgi:hypothetical protein